MSEPKCDYNWCLKKRVCFKFNTRLGCDNSHCPRLHVCKFHLFLHGEFEPHPSDPVGSCNLQTKEFIENQYMAVTYDEEAEERSEEYEMPQQYQQAKSRFRVPTVTSGNQYGAVKEGFGAGPSNSQHPPSRSSYSKRSRLDPTVAEEREELRMRIIQLEFDLKLEKVLMKEEVRQSEKTGYENRITEVEKRVNEKTEEVEVKKKEVLELQKEKADMKKDFDDKKLGYSKQFEELNNQVFNLQQQNQNVRQQLFHLKQQKGIPTASNMAGQVYGSAQRNNNMSNVMSNNASGSRTNPDFRQLW